MRRIIVIVAASASLACPTLAATNPVSSVRLNLPAQPSLAVESIARFFARQVRQRCEARVLTSGQASLKLDLVVEAGLGGEGFKITDGPDDTIRILGNDERGLLYGVGKFLRTSRYDQGGFTPGRWRGTSVPAMPVRGIYFATHFHNFYHDAPVEEVQRYVEDLALWGVNTLIVWYDMHHFKGWDDPAAVAFRERLRSVMQCARSVGMGVGLGIVSNEGYGNSPVELRADPSGMRGAVFVTDICTSKPEGQKYVLGNFAQLFDWAKNLEPGFVWIRPYDSGGCGCSQCKPWGSNGFLRAAERLARLARQKFPGVKSAVSTWFFDEGEWEGLARAFGAKPDWADYLISQPGTYAFSHSSPGGLPILGFPEISMDGMWPWGGFGAKPQPQGLQNYWKGQRREAE